MNCGEFKEHLFDLLDGALPGDLRAECEDHLAGCRTCREQSAQQNALAARLSEVMALSTKDLTLRPEMRDKIVTAASRPGFLVRWRRGRLNRVTINSGSAAERRSAPAAPELFVPRPEVHFPLAQLWRRIRVYFQQPAWGWAVATIFTVIAGFVAVQHFRSGEHRIATSGLQSLPVVVSIRVPQVLACYTFQKLDGFVIDSLVCQTNVMQERTWVEHRHDASDDIH